MVFGVQDAMVVLVHGLAYFKHGNLLRFFCSLGKNTFTICIICCIYLVSKYIAQKMKFSIKDFLKFSIVDLVTFTEEIFNEKLHFCAVVVTRIEPLVDDFLTLRFDISVLGSSYLIFGKYLPIFLTFT